jgi:hypothetical protein
MKEKKQFLEQRLSYVKQKITLTPAGSLPGLYPMQPLFGESPQMMAYIGGMASTAMTSLNGRIGYFISGSSNASLDVGFSKISGVSSANLGVSMYERSKSFVYGYGLLLNSGSGSTVFSLKLSVGISIMNKSRTQSFDVFLDGYEGLKKGALTSFSLSVGKGIYFGKRK